MKRFPSLLVVGLLLIYAPACSSTKPPTPAAIQGNKTITALKDLSSMYEKKNLAGFMSLISDDYKDRKEFAAAIEAVFAKYEVVHFTVQYSRMFITIADKGPVKATFNWDSDWRTAGGGEVKNSGRGAFVFDRNGDRLVSIDGKNPFIPQVVEGPGRQ